LITDRDINQALRICKSMETKVHFWSLTKLLNHSFQWSMYYLIGTNLTNRQVCLQGFHQFSLHGRSHISLIQGLRVSAHHCLITWRMGLGTSSSGSPFLASDLFLPSHNLQLKVNFNKASTFHFDFLWTTDFNTI
jgi:hypothetical protein